MNAKIISVAAKDVRPGDELHAQVYRKGSKDYSKIVQEAFGFYTVTEINPYKIPIKLAFNSDVVSVDGVEIVTTSYTTCKTLNEGVLVRRRQ
jgi:hypothetical protein